MSHSWDSLLVDLTASPQSLSSSYDLTGLVSDFNVCRLRLHGFYCMSWLRDPWFLGCELTPACGRIWLDRSPWVTPVHDISPKPVFHLRYWFRKPIFSSFSVNCKYLFRIGEYSFDLCKRVIAFTVHSHYRAIIWSFEPEPLNWLWFENGQPSSINMDTGSL